MAEAYSILRGATLSGSQIEDLRISVGWDRMDGYYDRILASSYTHFSVFEPHLEAFYRACGFTILQAGIIDTWEQNDAGN